MRVKRNVTIVLVLFPMIIGFLVSSSFVHSGFDVRESERQEANDSQFLRMDPDHLVNEGDFSLSQDSQAGIMNPVQVKQSGFQVTEAVRGRTDTGTNAIQNITVDDSNNWFANSTQVEVSNLKKLYGINGTFEDGANPWTNYTIDGGLNTQIVDYDAYNEYIICKNIGDYKWASQHTWTHSVGTEIGWEQVVNNSDGAQDFNMQLDFRYVTGPLDPEGDNGFPGVVGVFYQVEGDGWYYPMETLVASRNVWYSLAHEFTIPAPWSSFSIYVGLYLAGSITVNNVTDYDDDPLGLIDGTENAENITLYLDNVEFTGVNVPAFENVQLTFRSGAFSSAITGTGVGTATIANPSYWTEDPFQIAITSNTTVVFTYTVTTQYSRYLNTSWTTDPSKQGVSYSIASGESAEIGFYTYIASSSAYENLTIDLEYPWDWENATIWDPLRNNITNLCSIKPGLIHVPNSEMDRVGWWEIDLQAPNYAKNISIQIDDTGIWTDNSLFRPGNITRVQAEIGTASAFPSTGDLANFTWHLPNSTIWASDSISSMSDGIVNSSTWILGGLNTSAGQWEVEVAWTNGSEIAFDFASFDMYHTASLTPRESIVVTDVGLLITNMVYYVDEDTGEYIVDGSANIVANMSSTIVSFQANPVHNWYEADFNTSILGGGIFTVIVNASIPYFDNVTCQFIIESTFTTSISFPDVGVGAEEIGRNEIYKLNVSYLFANGTGIEDAHVDFAYSGPVTGLSNSSPSYLGSGVYTLAITGLFSGEYVVTITVTKSFHYSKSDQFTLIVGETDTNFVALNGTADLVAYGSIYHLVVHYTNSTGANLADADVIVSQVTPSTGLTVIPGVDTQIKEEGGGLYSVNFTPTVSGSYTIILKANITNHVTQYVTFTFLVTDVSTDLTPDTTSASTIIDQDYTVQLSYEDDSSNGIDGATISLIDAPSGISYIVDSLGGGSGLYNIILTPSVSIPTSFQLSFKASLTNYRNASTTFSLLVQNIPTELEVIIGDSSGTIAITQSYNITISYMRLDTTANISAADIVISTTPSDGLIPWWQVNGEVYNLGFTANRIGIWQISISANSTKFATATMILELEVLALDTVFTSLNGTVDEVGYGLSYTLGLNYTSIVGTGLSSSWVNVTEVNPVTGLTIGGVIDEGNGVYSILLTPTIANTYTVTIRANLTNHITRYITFSLLVTDTPTVLIPSSSGATISVDQNCTLQLTFQDTLTNGINDSIIALVDLPSDIAFNWTFIGNGVYNVTLTPSVTESKSFQISFRASLTNYQSSTTAFSLLVQEIPTNLEISEGGATAVILYLEQYQLDLLFVRTDTDQNITGASINVIATPSAGIQYQLTEVGEIYSLIFTTDRVGVWQISVSANKSHHVKDTLQLDLKVIQIETNLNDITLVEDLVYGRTYEFTFNYLMANGTSVIEADISGSGTGSDWITISLTPSSGYLVTLVPDAIGSFEISLDFSRDGFVSQVTLLDFDVREVLISIVDIQGLTGLEGSLSTLSLRLVDSETGDAISGASVAFQIIQNLVPGSTNILAESETEAGLYSASYIMPLSDSEAKIRIHVNLANHQVEGGSENFEADVVPTISEATALTRTITQYSPLILLAVVLVSGYSARRSYRRRKRKENIQALAVKRRFDDVRNMLGVVVLHKDSGIPVYSRMLKGGFDDSLISAFITAISQFRQEFDVSQKEWEITPISDIIMAVRTQNLVCAFITSGNPTKTQEERMIRFAKAVGLMFDSDFAEAPVLSIDEESETRFDDLFDEMLDMHLHRRHMIVDSKHLPKGPKCLNRTISDLEATKGFELEDMAEKIAACGLEEARVYKIIMDAIDRKDLVQIEEDKFESDSPTPSGMDADIEDLPEPITTEAEDTD
ncbi:MAG: hypothetical protein P1Q69_06690 [Candidatus Thorarchaeota archaeon]|nr:hypothetical protein [Candidatus Thorarchaeota archaeon]